MDQINLDEDGKHFLLGLFDAVNEDPSGAASLYDVGEALGMDRDKANFITTELISFGYAEIKTLSGAIGITDEGLDAAKNLGAGGKSDESAVRLGDEVAMDENKKSACEEMTAFLKADAGKLGLDFDGITELTSDLKTIDAQLNSPKPKTAIIRECFRSIRELMKNAGAGEHVARIDNFI